MYRHKKRGTVYTKIGEGQIQTEQPLKDYDVVVIYKNVETGDLYARRREEFYDGRYEEI